VFSHVKFKEPGAKLCCGDVGAGVGEHGGLPLPVKKVEEEEMPEAADGGHKGGGTC
jgi:hypothetical protein